uniref:Uncharacterized protein n=1 Tax=Oryza brachyantha TaxID=4533 RepID=J3NEF0_ORYBR
MYLSSLRPLFPRSARASPAEAEAEGGLPRGGAGRGGFLAAAQEGLLLPPPAPIPRRAGALPSSVLCPTIDPPLEITHDPQKWSMMLK